MLPKIQALALEGVTVECRESTEKSWVWETVWENDEGYLSKRQQNKLRYPGQFEMICYKISDNSSFFDSNGTFKWDHIHEHNLWSVLQPWQSNNSDFMSMETSFNLNTFELWILSDRCNPNHHCGDNYAFKELL